ncbi:MAG: hypothetical protein GX804_08195 [Lentisphaerae bacterium]|jgi:hypothetical protein|nr:hypothetical protein [Lentisphaerota bacterium]
MKTNIINAIFATLVFQGLVFSTIAESDSWQPAVVIGGLELLPNSSYRADNNYLLLFDDVTGKLIQGLYAGATMAEIKASTAIRVEKLPCCSLELDCRMVPKTRRPGDNHGHGMYGGIVTVPRTKPVPDDKALLPLNGIFGGKCQIWETYLWKQLGEELKKHESIKIFISTSPAYWTHINRGDVSSMPERFVEISRDTYARMEKLKRHIKYTPFFFHPMLYADDKNYKGAKVQLMGEGFNLKTHGPDHEFGMLVDRSSGFLAVYLEYTDLEEPRDLDLLDIARRITPESLKVADCRSLEEGSTNTVFGASAATLESIDRNIDAISKMEDPPDLHITIRRNQIVGTAHRIWNLGIWEELGRRIREDDRPYVLFFNTDDVLGLKRFEPTQSYLVMTKNLYEHFDAMRQKEERETAIETERATFRKMME